MPFSTKLKADYIEMINWELDSIPMERREEFNLIAQDLQNIITSDFVLAIKSIFCPKIVLPKATQDQLNYIRYCFNTPKDFVKSAADYSEYQQILKERITAKINEFRKFSEKEQRDYIVFQQEKHKGSEPPMV
ncbi:Uncharacterised protein [Legionella steigerwaltii]|uniref:Uncharacterized protein n=1 Tax=Legionella steigerwaltii TaxID=460 RepID=A0A378LBU2_9GAMM|nr:hypothetical protein [Legionella steigerwaltii]KTD78715.1 hypothetical protein Lstg_1184 [Legionella steigerwaltii]STY24194.1 Uncharacterised protein [Legionella steigerwaltii]